MIKLSRVEPHVWTERVVCRAIIQVLICGCLLVWLAVAARSANEPPQAMLPCGHAAGLCLSSLYPLPDPILTPIDTLEAAQRASVAAASTPVQVQP